MAARQAGTGAGSRRKPVVAADGPGPVLLGGIDIGSSAMRLKIGQYAPDAPLRIIEELTHPVPTGADSFRHGHILPATMFSVCNVVQDFLRILDDYGVEVRRAVASSSVREASNREILVDRIRHGSGLNLEVLDAVEESRLAYQALLPWLRDSRGTYSMALNLGGGSTEIMILRGDDLQTGGSRRLGTARLFHSPGQIGGRSRGERLQSIAANIVRSTRDAYADYNISRFFLINRLLYRAFRDDRAAERHDHDFVMPAEALCERTREAANLSPLEVGAAFNMGLTEVENLIPAMLILENFVVAAEVAEVTFTDTELLSGLLAEMTMILNGENPLMSFRRQMVRSARAVGEQYFYDRSHARKVTDFSLVLFDALREMLDLGDKDRLLLEVAAVLHDIGMYVTEHHHQWHGAYLVRWSDIVGLSENDRILVSQIVYFHRKDLPSRQHPEYMALAREERLVVNKLAGILRLADVLDRGHHQSVKGMRAEAADQRLVLHLQSAGDMGIITDALPFKADLIQQVTGLEVVLRRELPSV